MPRIVKHSRMSTLDHMLLSAGGRTDAELEAQMIRGHQPLRCTVCAAAADVLYRVVLKLEARAGRAQKRSHRRLA